MYQGIVGRMTEILVRRREPRLFADEQVILLVGVEARPAVARVMDRSVSGLRITHKVPLGEGNRIQVLTPTGVWRARVVWTTEEEGMWVSGLQLAKD